MVSDFNPDEVRLDYISRILVDHVLSFTFVSNRGHLVGRVPHIVNDFPSLQQLPDIHTHTRTHTQRHRGSRSQHDDTSSTLITPTSLITIPTRFVFIWLTDTVITLLHRGEIKTI